LRRWVWSARVLIIAAAAFLDNTQKCISNSDLFLRA
jgi:hypothetical protein